MTTFYNGVGQGNKNDNEERKKYNCDMLLV